MSGGQMSIRNIVRYMITSCILFSLIGSSLVLEWGPADKDGANGEVIERGGETHWR